MKVPNILGFEDLQEEKILDEVMLVGILERKLKQAEIETFSSGKCRIVIGEIDNTLMILHGIMLPNGDLEFYTKLHRKNWFQTEIKSTYKHIKKIKHSTASENAKQRHLTKGYQFLQ